MVIPKPITRHLQFMCKDTLVCDVWFNAFENKVWFKNHVTEWFLLPFGRCSDTTVLSYADLERVLLEDHCFPESRANCKELLATLGLEDYDALAIVQKTHGVMCNSDTWVRLDSDPADLSWEQVQKLLF